MSTPTLGLLDTSVLIAAETGRRLDREHFPDQSAISVVTLAELNLGVLAAGDTDSRARRLATLQQVADLALLPVDESVVTEWARLRMYLRERGRRMNVNDLWIASTAVARGIPVVTQDADFEALVGVPGFEVILI